MLSSRLVLPERYGPHNATTRCAPLPALPPVMMVSVFILLSMVKTSLSRAPRVKAPVGVSGRDGPFMKGPAGRPQRPRVVATLLSATMRTRGSPAAPRSERCLSLGNRFTLPRGSQSVGGENRQRPWPVRPAPRSGERGAGALDAAAGFLEQVGRRCIGD